MLDHMLRNVTEAQFQMDVFWIRQGGGDPVALLQQYPGRFVSLHLKDRLPGTPDSSDGRADDDSNVVLGSGDVGIAVSLGLGANIRDDQRLLGWSRHGGDTRRHSAGDDRGHVDRACRPRYTPWR